MAALLLLFGLALLLGLTARPALAGPPPPVAGLPVSLGTAGPQQFAVLETGSGASNACVSLVNGCDAGLITGNVGFLSTGAITDSAVPIKGNVYLAGKVTMNSSSATNVSGGIFSGSDSLLDQAASSAVAASVAAKALPSSGGGVGVSSITCGGTLKPGVYNLSSLTLPDHAVLILSAGGSYVFNISGALTMQSAKILLTNGLAEDYVLFNITGTHAVQISGTMNDESILYGMLLAPHAAISLNSGIVMGEIIGGENINLSGGSSVDDAAYSVHPAFFKGEAALSDGFYFLVFPNGNLFGYYSYAFFPYLYHQDLGFDYFFDANDGQGDAYFYDFTCNHFWYSGPKLFPYLYDFNLSAWLYYFPDPSTPGRYSHDPRSFYNFATGQIITL